MFTSWRSKRDRHVAPQSGEIPILDDFSRYLFMAGRFPPTRWDWMATGSDDSSGTSDRHYSDHPRESNCFGLPRDSLRPTTDRKSQVCFVRKIRLPDDKYVYEYLEL